MFIERRALRINRAVVPQLCNYKSKTIAASFSTHSANINHVADRATNTVSACEEENVYEKKTHSLFERERLNETDR